MHSIQILILARPIVDAGIFTETVLKLTPGCRLIVARFIVNLFFARFQSKM